MKLRMFLCCFAAALALTLCAGAADIVDSGTCGENVTYMFDSDGVLTISGTGKMDNYSSFDIGFYDNGQLYHLPWKEKQYKIVTVIIQNGVTSIGSYMFWGCGNLRSVTIPDSVISIGSSAFEDCANLIDVTIPDSVTSIGINAFWRCGSLTSASLGKGVTSISDYAFPDCKSLTSVTIPDSVTSIGWYAFDNCESLTDVYYGGSATQWNEIRVSDSGNDALKNATIHYNAKDVGIGITLTDKSGKTVDGNGQTVEGEGENAEKKDVFQDGAEFKASFTSVDPDASSGFVTASVFTIFYDKDGLPVFLEQKEIDLSDPFNLMFVLNITIPEGAKTLKILMLGDGFEPLRAARLIESSGDAA